MALFFFPMVVSQIKHLIGNFEGAKGFKTGKCRGEHHEVASPQREVLLTVRDTGWREKIVGELKERKDAQKVGLELCWLQETCLEWLRLLLMTLEERILEEL